jgi:hypothetical protein
VTEKDQIREELLKSIQHTATLLEKLKEAVVTAGQGNVALYRGVQLELRRLNSTLVDHHDRVKHAIDFEETHGRDPDYAYWARRHWTIFEAAALAAGREPESVHWDEPTHLLEWLEAAVKDGRLDEKIRPVDFLDWFDLLGGDNPLPPKLRRAVVVHRTTFFPDAEKRNLRAEDPGEEVQAQADIQAVKGSAKRAFEATNVLLEYFMNSSATVPINPDPEKLAVSFSDAQRLEPKLSVRIKDPKTIQKHLNEAVRTVRRLKKDAEERRTSGQRK